MSQASGIDIKITAKTQFKPGIGLRWRVAMWLINLGCRLASTHVDLVANINDKPYQIGTILKGKR